MKHQIDAILNYNVARLFGAVWEASHLSERLQALAALIQKPFRRMRPPQIVALVFLALVLTGSAILCLPVCCKVR